MKASYTVLVHGAAEPMPTRPSWLREAFHQFYRLIGVKSGKLLWMDLLEEHLKQEEFTIVDKFYWSGGWTKTFACRPAAYNLANFIANRISTLRSNNQLPPGFRIQLFGKSNGGIVCRIASTLLAGYSPPLKVNTIVQAAVPNRSPRPDLENVGKLINIYSPDDVVCKAGIRFFAPFQGTMRLDGDDSRIVNVCLQGFGHSAYNRDRIIQSGKYATQSLFDMYARSLADEL